MTQSNVEQGGVGKDAYVTALYERQRTQSPNHRHGQVVHSHPETVGSEHEHTGLPGLAEWDVKPHGFLYSPLIPAGEEASPKKKWNARR